MKTNPFDLETSFDEKALEVFEFQKANSEVYGRFCKALGRVNVDQLSEIPLIPIQAFKDVQVISSTKPVGSQALFFTSSGTSGMSKSRHVVLDPDLYRESIIKGMKHFYQLDEYVVLAYTPGYIANPNSSLIWMLNVLIERDKTGLSCFIELGKPLDQELIDTISKSGKKVMLFGAAFGLLDLIELGEFKLPADTVVIETGGMKTFRREMIKKELHQQLANGLKLEPENIHSEYGMTELLSQAYSRGNEWFECVPWMKVSIRDPKNPIAELPFGEEGLIGVIDLANINSCSFILTGDKGMQNEKGEFQVLGRWNTQNLRGCNFLIDQD
ncbi:MAG: hypothetical protein RLN81_17120 [Balneolaceae bacterium]